MEWIPISSGARIAMDSGTENLDIPQYVHAVVMGVNKQRVPGNGGACIEVASGAPGVVAVRDSKDPHGPLLAFTPGRWTAFTSTVKG